MNKKLITILTSCILTGSLMIGCSSNSTKLDSSNTLTQVQKLIENNYKVLEANLNDDILVVKTEIDYNGDYDYLFKRNLHAIEDLLIRIDLSNIKELQYWSVCKTTDNGTKKTFSCTIGKGQLKMIQDGKVVASDIGNMTSKMTDLYLNQEILLGLSDEIRAQIVINNIKNNNNEDAIKETQNIDTKDINNTDNKGQPTTKHNENNNKPTTNKPNNQPNKDNSNKKDDENNKDKSDKEDKHSYVTCPNCNKKIEVNKYGKGTCKNCGLYYFPGCVKDGTHLQEEADKQDKKLCPECGLPYDKCICDGDRTEPIDSDDNSNVEDEKHYYGIDGKEQTREDFIRQNRYAQKGYTSHIDENGDEYWTDDEGNEYR